MKGLKMISKLPIVLILNKSVIHLKAMWKHYDLKSYQLGICIEALVLIRNQNRIILFDQSWPTHP